MPSTNAPESATAANTASAIPRDRIQDKSSAVALEPPSTIKSGRPSSRTERTKRTATSDSPESGSRSVKFDNRGKAITATSSWASARGGGIAVSATESSASRCRSPSIGTTPSVGTPQRRSNSSRPSPSRAGSPQNLLITNPRTRRRCEGGSSATVPANEAKTPPRSMSPATTTWASRSPVDVSNTGFMATVALTPAACA